MLHSDPCYYLNNPNLVKPKWIGEKEKMQKELENLGIGEDIPQLEAKRVKVLDLEEKDVKFKDKDSKKLVLKVIHSDGQVEMEISRVKYEKANKLKEGGLWLSKDKDGNLPFRSAVACLLRFYKLNKLSGLIGKEIDTIANDEG